MLVKPLFWQANVGRKILIMEIKYSQTEFEGYTHRFVIQFEVGQPYFSNLQLYSNSDSYLKLEDFINEKKSQNVISFKITHRASKEQDELSAKLIDDTLSGI